MARTIEPAAANDNDFAAVASVLAQNRPTRRLKVSANALGAYPLKRTRTAAKRKDVPITRAALAANARFPPTVPRVLSRSYPHQVTQLDRSFSFTFMWPLTDITGK